MRPETLDIIALNQFEKDVRGLAGEIHDVGFDDIPEARFKLDGIVSACSDLLGRLNRRERDDADRHAREEMETSIPPYGAA